MTAELYLVYILGIQTRKTGKKNTPNNLGYTENISKSPPPHSASDEVFSLIFIQPFYVIHFLIWACKLIKKQRNMLIEQHFLIKRNVENHSLFHPFRPLEQTSPQAIWLAPHSPQNISRFPP